MLRRLHDWVGTVSDYFANDIEEINAQNWSVLRVLT